MLEEEAFSRGNHRQPPIPKANEQSSLGELAPTGVFPLASVFLYLRGHLNVKCSRNSTLSSRLVALLRQQRLAGGEDITGWGLQPGSMLCPLSARCVWVSVVI